MIRYIDEQGMISPTIREFDIDTAVTTFSEQIFDAMAARYGAKKAFDINGCVTTPVYEINIGGKRIFIYRSYVGAPAAVGDAEEVLGAGVKNLIAFGICGALVDLPVQTVIVPDRAYRDEGTSYHYMPASEYIDLKNANRVETHLNSCGIHTAKGGTWTTDGFYRETRTRLAEMQSAGCIAVDMECSALQALCDFRKKNFYTFFISADSLAGEEWEPNYIRDGMSTDIRDLSAEAAIKLAIAL